MKKLRRTCAVTILTLALTACAYAGQIDCPGAPQPPPTQPSVVTTILLVIVSLVR